MLTLPFSRRASAHAVCLSLTVLPAGCPAPGAEPKGGDSSSSDTGSSESVSSSSSSSSSSTPTTGAQASTAGTQTTDGTGGADTVDTGDTGALPCEGAGAACDDPVVNCEEDRDHDGVTLQCDNAPDHTNPDQRDIDKDGFGDIFDLCPTIASINNEVDTDQDGVGDPCDLCARKPAFYNQSAGQAPARMRVRNIPLHGDADRDGIGDACDNCVWVPNCAGFGDGDGLVPYTVGDPIDVEAADCQSDLDTDFIGDACAGAMRPGAAGPVGLGDDDDFDQDGLVNLVDKCPRQPVTSQACVSDSDCGANTACVDGACNHLDQDNDGLGDICDTCPQSRHERAVPRARQVLQR